MNNDVPYSAYFIFKGKISRIRDIQVHPGTGKIYFLNEDSLWLMEKN